MSQTLRLTATVVPDGEWFVARCVEVEVASQGRTIEEALANLREALELYYEDEPAPEAPPEPIVAPIEVRLSARALVSFPSYPANGLSARSRRPASRS